MSSDKLSVFNSRARIDLEHDPVKIRLHPTYTKTGKKRITFMSPEAKDALIEWLTFRQQYLDQAEGRSATYERKQEYNVIFPFTSANYNAMWRNALTKANLLKRDSQTNRMTMRPHNLRKFFRLRVAKNGRDEAEALMGHQKGLNAVYARFEGEYGDQRLEEAYVKSIPELSIYKRSVELSKLQQEIVQKNQTLQDELQQMNAQRSEQQIIINKLSIENLSMKDTIQQLQRDQQQLRTDNIQVQQQIAAINEMMTELSESDVENSMKPKYNDMVWDHIQAETGINAESVVYEIQTVNDKHIINVRGYYLQGKYHKYPVTIGIKI